MRRLVFALLLVALCAGLAAQKSPIVNGLNEARFIWRAEVVHDSGSSGRQPGTILAADADGIVVNCGSGALRLLELQKPGARRVSSVDYLRSNSLALG